MRKTDDEILRAMEECRYDNCRSENPDCPYQGEENCVDHAHDDAIELIRELQDRNRAQRAELLANGKKPSFPDIVKKFQEYEGEQAAKHDQGKPRLSLVPTRIIYAIARIREYGNRKYGGPDNWKAVEPRRYRDAAFRHLLDYIADPKGVDSESGLPHLWHLACNIAFLCEMEGGETP